MDNKKKIEIPFGAFDSELYYQEINIPDGFEATIKDNKIILKRKESEDERIRKGLIKAVSGTLKGNTLFGTDVTREDALTWLEKRGKEEYVLKSSKNEDVRKFMQYIEKEAKAYEFNLPNRGYDIYAFAKDILVWLEKQDNKQQGKTALEENVDNTNKVEQKFKVGDWIILNENHNSIYQVERIGDYRYHLRHYLGGALSARFDNGLIRQWTIQDAKEGDVLSYVTDEEDLWIMIYWSLYEPYEGHVHYHALLVNDNFSDKGTCCICINDLKPATKEQRDLLFKKMREEGYEWDTEKKELKSLEKQGEQKEYTFKSLPRLLDMIEPTSKARAYCQKLIDTLVKEGYSTDAKIVGECLKQMNGEKVALATMDEKQAPKLKWTEEDEKVFNNLIGSLIRISHHTFTDCTSPNYTFFTEIEWLKEIKQRMEYK